MQSRGFTLIEVVVALSVLCVAVLAVGQLLAGGVEGMAVSRSQTMTATLASARLEQLRGLAFAFDDGGARVTDLATNLSLRDPGAGGGGLTSAGADSLQSNTPGYIDYLDRHGRWVGNGIAPPPAAAFVRRWSIDPLGASPDALVLQVIVRPLSEGIAATIRRGRSETRLITILARTHR